MSANENLDLQALTAAKRYMGDFAWPTVVLGTAIVLAYLATPLLVVAGHLPLLLGVLLMALLTYAAYTVLHEAAHGSISGSHTSLRWVNELMGYLAAWVIMIPLTSHRHEHLAHHRYTNEPDGDPDFIMSEIGNSPWRAVQIVSRVYLEQFAYYLRHRWSRGPRRQDVFVCLEILAAWVPRIAFFAAGYWVEGLALFVVAEILGLLILLYLFAYIVHTPHESVGRYVDTSTIVVPGFAGKIITVAWGYQNYHSIHHLFPRIPFYRYPALFAEIQGAMIANGAPVYRRALNVRLYGQTNGVVPAYELLTADLGGS